MAEEQGEQPPQQKSTDATASAPQATEGTAENVPQVPVNGAGGVQPAAKPDGQDTEMSGVETQNTQTGANADGSAPPASPQTTPQKGAATAMNGTPPATGSPNASSAEQIPAKAASHGASVRQYLNSKVTGVLLEGMKKIAQEQPSNPLHMLGEYLLQKSQELEAVA